MSIFWRQEKKTNRRNAPQKPQRQWLPQVVLSPRVLGVTGAGLVVLAGVSGIWWKLMDPETLPLRQVQLEAPFVKTSKEMLYRVVESQVSGGFFTVDVDAITKAVESLPWVERAAVRRQWPDSLQVTVWEQKALANWEDTGLINVRGELFYPALESFPSGLVKLQGPESAVALMATQFRAIKERLQQVGLYLTRVRLTPRRAWELELENSIVIALGRKDLDARLARFVQFYPQLAARQLGPKQVDMRYTNGFAVQWHTPSA